MPETKMSSRNQKKSLFEDEATAKYPQFVQHIKKNLLPRKEEWAISERIENHLSKHNVNTTNYVEISFRITKDNQFNRVAIARDGGFPSDNF